MSLYLGIDSSTQSMTGLVIDTEEQAIVAEASINFDECFAEAYDIESGVRDLGSGVMHGEPLVWIEALDLLFEALRNTGIDLGRIEAIAGSGQQHGTVYLNDTAEEALGGLSGSLPLKDQVSGIFSRATAPIWMDTSTGDQCREIETNIGGTDHLLGLTGNTAFERFSGPQIRKFWQEEPDNYEQTDCVCLVSSFIASILAGQLVPVDAGDGSGTNLMDIRTRQWAPTALDATAPDLAARLLPVTPSTRAVGTVSPYFVERYGVNAICRILPFSGDNPCSLIGLGLVEPGQVALSLGTGDTLFACIPEPVVSEDGEGCLFASPDDIHYMALICFLNGSLAREAVRDRYVLDWEGFAQGLRSTPPGNKGGMILPYFDPEIVPHVPKAGVIRENLDDGDAMANVRAVVEAQAMSSKIHARWMEVAITSINVTGGASANEEILQIYASVHGCPVHRFETTNGAALGAALRASQGHRPDISWQEVVEPFTQPIAGSTVRPDPATADTYASLIQAYEALEKRHTG
jgi:xylulokinase